MLLKSNLFSWARAAASGLSPLLFLALLPGHGLAVTISGSAACMLSGFASATTPLPGFGTASCSLQGTDPMLEHSNASATAGSFSVSASANVAWGNGSSKGSSSGKASVMEEYQVEAIGATGPGFLLLTPFVSTTPDQGSGTTFATVSVDSASGPVTSIESHLGSMATCSPCEFAVNLGTIYDFTLEASVDSEADFLNPDDSGMASAGLSFQFYEANGTTPVSAEVIPEPGTVSLVGCALLVGLVFGLRRRKHI